MRSITGDLDLDETIKSNMIHDAKQLGLKEPKALVSSSFEIISGEKLNRESVMLPNEVCMPFVYDNSRYYFYAEVRIVGRFMLSVAGNEEYTVIIRHDRNQQNPILLFWRSYNY